MEPNSSGSGKAAVGDGGGGGGAPMLQPAPAPMPSANAPPPFLVKTYDMVDDPSTERSCRGVLRIIVLWFGILRSLLKTYFRSTLSIITSPALFGS